MYHEAMKQQFLSGYKGNTLRYNQSLLEKLKAGEAAIGKDIGEMTKEEWSRAIQCTGAYQYASVARYVTVLKSYAKWYSDHVRQLLNAQIDGFSSEDVDITENMRRAIPYPLEPLLAAMEEYPAKEGFLQQPVACLAYLGLDRSQMQALKKDAVKLRKNTVIIKLQDRQITSEQDAIFRVFKEYSKVDPEKQYVRHHIAMQQQDLGYYLKRMHTVRSKLKDRPLSVAEISRSLTWFAEQHPAYREVSISLLNLAGGLCRLWEAEQREGSISEELLRQEFQLLPPKGTKEARNTYLAFRRAFGLARDS